MTYTIPQIELFAAITKMLEKQFAVKACSSRQLNAILEATNTIVAALGKEDITAKAGSGLAAWLASDDTGLSSKFMAWKLCQGAPMARYAHPHDPDDFGRCYRFLESVPEVKERLGMMSVESDDWAALVDNWVELVILYEEEFPTGTCPKLYERMKELLK